MFNSKKLQRFTMGQGVRFVVGGILGFGAGVGFTFSVAGNSVFLNLVFGLYIITSLYVIAYGIAVIKSNKRSA